VYPPLYTAPTLPPIRARRLIAPGVIIVFAAALAIIGVVTSSLATALGQARVIAYPQPAIQIVSPNAGQTARVGDQLSFSINIQAGHDLTVNWDFGDGGTAQGTSVVYVYNHYGTYTAQATATDPLGQTANASYQLQILTRPPVAAFTFEQDPSGPLVYDFDASASTGDTALTYNWDFGDGQTENDTTPQTTHSYSALGSYHVTLTVSDQDNQTSSPVTQTVKISVAKPVASFTAVNDPSCLGSDYVTFDASASTGYQNQLTYTWDYGDGYTDSGVTTYHYFPFTGYFNVTLSVTDTFGQHATLTQSVYAC
jgi:PKD repeat protein